MLFHRIPKELAFGLHGDVVDQTSRTRPVTYFGGRDRGFSALDTFQPVAMLVGTFVEMDFVGTDDAIKDFGIAGNQRLRSLGCFSSWLPSWFRGCGPLVPGDTDPSLAAIKPA